MSTVSEESTADVDSKDSYWKEQFKTLGQELSVSGLRFATDGRENIIRRLVWLLLIGGGVVLMVYQMALSYSYYASHPTATKIERRYEMLLALPSVTVCDENRFVRRRLKQYGINNIVASVFPPLYSRLWNFPSRSQIRTAFSSFFGNASDLRGHFLNISTQLSTMLISCTFNAIDCHSSDITEVWTTMGRCATFNPNQTMMVESPGFNSGLRLLLTSAYNEQTVLNSMTEGFAVYLHNSTDKPDMYKSFKIKLGGQTYVKVEKKTSTILPEPWGRCSPELTGKNHVSLGNCYHDCLVAIIYERCRCYPLYADANTSTCDFVDTTACVEREEKLFYRHRYDICSCKTPCYSDEYLESLSYQDWSNHLLTFVKNNSHIFNNILVSNLERSMASVSIYYPAMAYTLLETTKAYNEMQLLGDLGGALGLLLGSTFFTLWEVFDILFWAAIAKCKMDSNKTRNDSESHKNSHTTRSDVMEGVTASRKKKERRSNTTRAAWIY